MRHLILRTAYAEEIRRLYPEVYVTRDREAFYLTVHYRGQSCRLGPDDMRYATWQEVKSKVLSVISAGSRSSLPNFRYFFSVKFPIREGTLRHREEKGYRDGELSDVRRELMQTYATADRLEVLDLERDKRAVFSRFERYHVAPGGVWVERGELG